MPRRILLQNTTLVDVAAGALLPRTSIALRDAIVESVGVAAGRFETTIDGAGLFACPGLIDCHTHLFLDGGADPRGRFLGANDADKFATAKANAALALRAGITTVRDCGAPAELIFAFRGAIDRGEIPGPRVLTCGAPITRPAGHCHFFGIEVTQPAEVQRAVERQVAQGASFVKLIASGGGLTPGTRPAEADLSAELIRAAAEAAHANGVYATAHCHATESMVRCLDAGVDMIEHATFLTPDGVPDFDSAIARRMRDQGTVLSPTVISGTRIAEQILRLGQRNRDDEGAVRRLRARREHLSRFFECGVRIVAGTDCGVPNTRFDSLADELAAYVEAGMTPPDALRSATSDAAGFLGRGDLGRIATGSPADLLLLTGNPLENVETLRQPAVVIKAGEIVCDFRTVGAR